MNRRIPCTVYRDIGDATWQPIDTLTLEEGRRNDFHGDWTAPGPGRYLALPFGDKEQVHIRFSHDADFPMRFTFNGWTITDAAIARGEKMRGECP